MVILWGLVLYYIGLVKREIDQIQNNEEMIF